MPRLVIEDEIHDLGDVFYDKARPREGFEYPAENAKITALQDYVLGGRTIIKAGAEGFVTGLRLPGSHGKEHHGFTGCIVAFPGEPAFKYDPNSKTAPYDQGVVIPWDIISDPARFEFPAPDQKAAPAAAHPKEPSA